MKLKGQESIVVGSMLRSVRQAQVVVDDSLHEVLGVGMSRHDFFLREAASSSLSRTR